MAQLLVSADTVTQGHLIRLFRALKTRPLPDDPLKLERDVRLIECAIEAGWLTAGSKAVMEWPPREVAATAAELDRIYSEATSPDPKAQ